MAFQNSPDGKNGRRGCGGEHNCDDGLSGGGIYNDGTLTLTRCDLKENAAGNGGGLYNRGNSQLIGVTIVNNTAGGSTCPYNVYGGGISLKIYGIKLTGGHIRFRTPLSTRRSLIFINPNRKSERLLNYPR